MAPAQPATIYVHQHHYFFMNKCPYVHRHTRNLLPAGHQSAAELFCPQSLNKTDTFFKTHIPISIAILFLEDLFLTRN